MCCPAPRVQTRSAVQLRASKPDLLSSSVHPKSDLLSSSVRPKSGLLPPSTLTLAWTLSEWDTAVTALPNNGHQHYSLTLGCYSRKGAEITLPAFSCRLQTLRPELLSSRGVTSSSLVSRSASFYPLLFAPPPLKVQVTLIRESGQEVSK